jgi:hypothetical protein
LGLYKKPCPLTENAVRFLELAFFMRVKKGLNGIFLRGELQGKGLFVAGDNFET